MSNVIWVDDQDKVLGEITREKAHREGLIHRIAVIYVVNEKGEILVNERAEDGHLDHSSAGHVDVGESYLKAAKRELEEELGISRARLKECGLTWAQDRNKNSKNKHMMKIFMCKATPVRLKKDEVKSVFWMNAKTIQTDMKIHPQKYTNGFRSSLAVFLKRSSGASRLVSRGGKI